MKKILMWAVAVGLMFSAADLCRAGEFVQKDGAFTVSVLDEWAIEAKEDDGEVLWIKPAIKQENGPAMSLRLNRRLDPAAGITTGLKTPDGVEEGELLDHYFDQATTHWDSVDLVTLTSRKRILLDGRPAFRIDVMADLTPQDGAVSYVSMYGCVTKDYLYEISISSPTEDGKTDMEQMLGTLKIIR